MNIWQYLRLIEFFQLQCEGGRLVFITAKIFKKEEETRLILIFLRLQSIEETEGKEYHHSGVAV